MIQKVWGTLESISEANRLTYLCFQGKERSGEEEREAVSATEYSGLHRVAGPCPQSCEVTPVCPAASGLDDAVASSSSSHSLLATQRHSLRPNDACPAASQTRTVEKNSRRHLPQKSQPSSCMTSTCFHAGKEAGKETPPQCHDLRPGLVEDEGWEKNCSSNYAGATYVSNLNTHPSASFIIKFHQGQVADF